jgi:hypothetical protein
MSPLTHALSIAGIVVVPWFIGLMLFLVVPPKKETMK